MRTTAKAIAWLLAALCITPLGCGKGYEGGKLAPVSGVVTLDGQPAAGIMVLFSPTAETGGQGGMGTTDASGKYELKTRGEFTGVVPGQYKVTCVKYVMPDGSPIPNDPNFSMATSGAKQVLPAKYSDPQRTVLSAKVPTEGTAVPLELTSK
ncbi:MAG: hypothetical protein ABFD16_21235 [Thermoguttaceae bacterium]|jgi:hypothetical protein